MKYQLFIIAIIGLILGTAGAFTIFMAPSFSPGTQSAQSSESAQPTQPAQPAAMSIVVEPAKPMPGQPIMITLDQVTAAETKSVTVNGKTLLFFDYDDKLTAFFPLPLEMKAGTYPIEAVLKNGTKISHTLEVISRPKIEAPLGIPEKLGGNTPQAATKLVSNLDKENAVLNSIVSAGLRYWEKPFQFPIKNVYITDEYGYSRQTGQYSIPHKGTDFRAAEGTPIYAMNDGRVELARTFTVYGESVAIDHGLGVTTLYLHLSKLSVVEGQAVKAGQQIGLSGSTGYAESPHLHLSLKINAVSIDPMIFLSFFGVQMPQ